MHVVIIAFTIIGSKEFPNSPGGNHVLALINTDENYIGLKEAMKDICDEIKHTFVKAYLITLILEYFFCADWKFLALCVGIDAVNATFACKWCKCPKCETWSLTYPDEGARSMEEIHNCAKRGKKSNEKYNYSRQPILPIPLDHVVPNILHVFL